jgi:hypothetical protein
VYSRNVQGQIFDFGVSGKLIMNVLVMYDRQTDSLWSQLLGRAVAGEMEGVQLEYFPSWMTTWDDWKARHPGTLALVKGYQGARDQYLSYYTSDRAGVLGETSRDDRLSRKEWVVGVTMGQDAVAYPFLTLNKVPVVNDWVDDQPILIVFDKQTANFAVFNRWIEGQELHFEHQEGILIQDLETGSVWDGIEGKAIDGPMLGQELERVRSTGSFWFGWKDFYPQTRVYGELKNIPNPADEDSGSFGFIPR